MLKTSGPYPMGYYREILSGLDEPCLSAVEFYTEFPYDPEKNIWIIVRCECRVNMDYPGDSHLKKGWKYKDCIILMEIT